MIPVLARSAERAGHDPQEKARVGHITSALLTWTVITLLPLAILVAAASALIAGLLNPANAHAHCARADVVGVTGGMLAVFAPQIILSGISVVLYGLLQTYRRFVGPALGPGVSSLVVISAYLAFAPADRGLPLSKLPLTAELILSVGTTLGVAALLAVALFPTWRLHLTFRPRLRFPPGVARRAGGLALIGVIEIIAYDLSIVVALVLANGHGPAAGPGARADRGTRPVRPGAGRIRRHHEHVTGDDGTRPAQGRGRRGGGQLARGDRGRRGAGHGGTARLVVAALALGNSLGQTVVAVPLVLAARRIRGPEAVRGPAGRRCPGGGRPGRRGDRRGRQPGAPDGRQGAGGRGGHPRGRWRGPRVRPGRLPPGRR